MAGHTGGGEKRSTIQTGCYVSHDQTRSSALPWTPDGHTLGQMSQGVLQTDRITLVPSGDEHLELEVELD